MASLTLSTLYGSPISLSYQSSGSSYASSSSRSYHPNLQVLCRQSTSDISEERTNKVPRRSIAVATVLAVLMESCSLQEAHAARKKTAETPLKKPEEDKALSAYDAKLLATYRRKEAMKEAMAKQKEKSKPRKPAAVEPMPVVKSEPEAATKAPETPASSVAEAVKESVEAALPSSE